MKIHISLLIATLFSVMAISAKTITVTSDADSGEGTLREAVNKAEENDSVIFDNEITTIYLSGVIIIDKNISINGNVINNTIIQRTENWTTENKNYFRTNEEIEVKFQNLAINNSNATCTGGAINNSAQSLTITDCTFSNNARGAVVNSKGILYIDNCSFQNNSAPSTSGGAIRNLLGELHITNSVFVQNSSSNAGAIYNDKSACTIDNSIFEENSSQFGGAIVNYGEMTIGNCTFNKNGYEIGGAICNNESGNLSVNNSIFSENESEDGGVFRNAGNAKIINCLFSKNYATNKDFFDANRHTIIHNYSVYSPPKETVTLSLINSTIVDNEGVGLYSSLGSVILQNNIFWNNIGFVVWQNTYLEYDVYVEDGNITAANNLIGTGNTDLSDNNNLFGTENDPLFADDYSLQEGSPAIDKGNNAYLTEEITTDLLGKPRISNNTVDLGAYEFQSESLSSIGNISNSDIKVYSQTHTIYIENATEPVSIYTILGHLIAQGTEKEFNVPQSGLYIVKTGETTTKIVVYK